MTGNYIGTHDFTNATVLGIEIGGISKYIDPFTSQTSVVVTHNLNDSYPIVQIYDGSGVQILFNSVTINSANQLTVAFGEAQTGTVVVHKAPTAQRFTDAFTSQTSVVVNHNLDDSYPVVQVYDNSNVQILPNSITINSSNQLTVTFGDAQTGTILVHKGD